MACDKILFVKILELVFCLACMIYMRVTDYESRQVFYLLQKLNREWPLLNSVTWEENGAIFTHVVFGSYIIITVGLLIGHVCGELKHGRKMEKYFLLMGTLLYVIVGSLIYASLDSVPPYLVKNAAALGTLALLTGLLFILDVGLSRPKPPPIQRLYKATQTETHVDLLDKVHRVPNGDSVIGELRTSLKDKRRTDDELRHPSYRNSIPDLTMHENGRSRGSPQEDVFPAGYRRSQNGHSTPESSVQPATRFPADIIIHQKRRSQEHPESHHASDKDLRTSQHRSSEFLPDREVERAPQKQPMSHQLNEYIPDASQHKRTSHHTDDHRNGDYVPTDRDVERRGVLRDQRSPTSYIQENVPKERDVERQGVLRDQRSPTSYIQENVAKERDVERQGVLRDQRSPTSYIQENVPKERDVERQGVLTDQRSPTRPFLEDIRYLDLKRISPEQEGSYREVNKDKARLSDPQQSRNSTSSGEQRYLEQSEISQRPESITPEERHRPKRDEMYRGSDSDVEDIMRVPTVSFLLTERGEPVAAHPGGTRLKPQREVKSSLKDTKLLPMMPITSTPKETKGALKSRSADSIAEGDKEKYLFGGRPKLSSSRSLDVEAGRLDISQSPSPDAPHWRYDSRDANLVRMERELPSSPSDPGFVRHTAHNWPESAPRTPSQSPVGSLGVTSGSRIQNWPDSRPRTPSQSPQNWSESAPQTPTSSQQVNWPQSDESDYAIASPPPPPSKPPVAHLKQAENGRKSQKGKKKPQEEEDDDEEDIDMPSGGSLTTQLLQKWLKQRKTKVGKIKSNP